MSSCIEASPVADVLIEKEANRIHARIKDLVALRNQSVSANVPGCQYIIGRRLADLERAKKCFESDAGQKINAILQARLRVDLMSHYNVRGAARKQFLKAKNLKNRVKFLKVATKKRLFF